MFSSLFSSIVSAFAPASTPQPDTLTSDPIAQPEPLPSGDNNAPKSRRYEEAKHQRRYEEAKHQRRYEEESKHQRRYEESKSPAEPKSKPSISLDQADLDAKPQPQPQPKSKPSVSPDQGDLDALFQEYLRWQAWQALK